jgi:murein L,D-transpeptidase YcbB/YkuD
VLHFTVRAEEGRLSFHPDIYGWDRKLVAALAGARRTFRSFDLAQGAAASQRLRC